MDGAVFTSPRKRGEVQEAQPCRIHSLPARTTSCMEGAVIYDARSCMANEPSETDDVGADFRFAAFAL